MNSIVRPGGMIRVRIVWILVCLESQIGSVRAGEAFELF